MVARDICSRFMKSESAVALMSSELKLLEKVRNKKAQKTLHPFRDG